jgi:cytochrome c556
MKLRNVLLVALASACLLTACDSAKKAGAEATVKTAETAFAAVSTEAQQYVPDQAKALQESLNQAKANLANGDYAAAIETAKGLPAQIQDVADAAKAKKEEFTAKWNDLNTTMPGLVGAVQGRFDTLKKTHKLPAGADDALASLKQAWGGASTSFQSGDLASAMEKATAAREKLADLQKLLGMKASS